MSRRDRRMAKAVERKVGQEWLPLQRAEYTHLTANAVQEAVRVTGRPEAEVRAELERETSLPIYINHLYQVQVRELGGGWTHLNIRRRDGAVIFRDWRHFQNIKNQLCGPEREAMELYPAESRLVDTSNKYHLWVAPAGVTIPIGFGQRDVSNVESATPGFAQRVRP